MKNLVRKYRFKPDVATGKNMNNFLLERGQGRRLPPSHHPLHAHQVQRQAQSQLGRLSARQQGVCQLHFCPKFSKS
jgi:hypothetical protein